jgi:hypothetical protein
VPREWLSRRELAGLLSAAVTLGATGCSEKTGQAGPGATAPKALAAIVAPIFAHGDGRGAFGCVAVNPPTFLSEEEALQVIREELGQAGIELSQSNAMVPGVAVPPRTEVYGQDWVTGKTSARTIEDTSRAPNPLVVDLKDPQRNIAIEFISQNDYFQMGGVNWQSTVQGYDFKDVAGYVTGHARKASQGGYLGFFYEPLASTPLEEEANDASAGASDWQKRWEQRHARGKAEGKRLLRMQVKDFVDWLKGQGVI